MVEEGGFEVVVEGGVGGRVCEVGMCVCVYVRACAVGAGGVWELGFERRYGEDGVGGGGWYLMWCVRWCGSLEDGGECWWWMLKMMVEQRGKRCVGEVV